MSDVIVVEQCCYCHRNLSVEKLIHNESKDVYYCSDLDDCRNAQEQNHEQPTRYNGRVKGTFSHPHLRFHYKQSSCGNALMGFFVGISVFFGSWVYAIKAYGWFLGLGLGWIPSFFLGIMAGMFWPIAIILILGLLLFSR